MLKPAAKLALRLPFFLKAMKILHQYGVRWALQSYLAGLSINKNMH